MDHQLTGVFTKLEEVRYISGIYYKNNDQLYKLRGHSLYFRKNNHVSISFTQDRIRHSKQWRPWSNAASKSVLFANIRI